MNKILERHFEKCEQEKDNSDLAYFYSLLYFGEALTKLIVSGMLSSVADDKDRNRYRIEHMLIRADGIGEWSRAIDDITTGPASQHLILNARPEQSELTMPVKSGEWQYNAVSKIKSALIALDIDFEDIPTKTDLRRWFRAFAVLRNKTRGHGIILTPNASSAAVHLFDSIKLICENFGIFKRQWAYLYKNMNGKFRVSVISDSASEFAYLKQQTGHKFVNGVHISWGGIYRVPLLISDPELLDYKFTNGGFSGKVSEYLSYLSGDKEKCDTSEYLAPPSQLPPSETEGIQELDVRGNCFTNAPNTIQEYIPRPELEKKLSALLADERRSIVTLIGRGGIGKTSLALKVINDLCEQDIFNGIIWFSSRDVDLEMSGPKLVRPTIFAPSDVAKMYSGFTLSSDKISEKNFNALTYIQEQFGKSDIGKTLFVFDNFETTQSPIDMFFWIDAYIRHPNKVLITTRLRDFKGDYPLDVPGMNANEAQTLIMNVAQSLNICSLLTDVYINELIDKTEGHPYVMKILLGEIAKNGKAANIQKIIASTEDILTALFERTYAALSPCAQRAFLTLSAWNSPVSILALSAVLYSSTDERSEIENGIESLIQFSMAEISKYKGDQNNFISLPLVASVFGKKKLNISPLKPSILNDVEILQMFGVIRRTDLIVDNDQRISRFLKEMSQKIDAGRKFNEFEPILDVICRAYNKGWLIFSRWLMEDDSEFSYRKAKEKLEYLLEDSPTSEDAALAWERIGFISFKLNDPLSGVHAFVERSQLIDLPMWDLSNTANKLNAIFKLHPLEMDTAQKRDLAARLLRVISKKADEASADDFSRMAWLAINLRDNEKAKQFSELGYKLDPHNDHINKLLQKFR